MGVYLRVDDGTTVQTFDFQNDGDLGWVGATQFGTPTLVSGEGWTIGSSTTDNQAYITPPSSIFNNQTLKKVKIWAYKQDPYTMYHTCGVGIGGTNVSCMWCQFRNSSTPGILVRYGGNENRANTTDATGELTLEFMCNDDGTLTYSVNGGTETNLGNYSTAYRAEWTGQNFILPIGKWKSGTFYIRKVEITTV